MVDNVSIFDELRDEELAQIISISEDSSFTSGQTIFEQDTPGDCLYIIKDGEVALSKKSDVGEKVELGILEAGAFLGELSILDGGRRAVTAIARTDAEMFKISKSKLDMLQLESAPLVVKFYLAIIRDINERLRVVNENYVSARQNLI